MKLNNENAIELTAEEVRALEVIRRLGERCNIRSIEDLKDCLPIEYARLIDDALEDACSEAYEIGYGDGYEAGRKEKKGE